MDASELAQRMLEWENLKKTLDILTKAIEEAVLELGETQTVGNVRASYSQGRKTYDYKSAIEQASIEPNALVPFQTVNIDYRAACDNLKIADIPFTQSPPTVTVKLLPK